MPVDLKGGFTTEDVRLDRLPSFDEKSRNFPIKALLAGNRPYRSRSYQSKLWLDQGREGACVSFAWHHDAGGIPVAVLGLTNEVARQRYFEMQKEDEWDGGAYPGASPFYEGTSVLAGAKVMQAAGFFTEYRWAFGIDEALLALMYEGPVVFGIPWLDSMFNTELSGLLDCSGREAGGHAIYGRGVTLPRNGVATVHFPDGTISKIRTSEPLVRFRNSWNTDWGRSGECLIRASDLERLLKTGGECCVPVGRRRP